MILLFTGGLNGGTKKGTKMLPQQKSRRKEWSEDLQHPKKVRLPVVRAVCASRCSIETDPEGPWQTLQRGGCGGLKKSPGRLASTGAGAIWKTEETLRFCHTCGLQTLRSLGDFEANFVPFGQGLIPVTDNLLEMHKNIVAAFARYETVALGSVKPFHCPCFHGTDPFELCTSATGGHGHVHPTVCSENAKSQPGL